MPSAPDPSRDVTSQNVVGEPPLSSPTQSRPRFAKARGVFHNASLAVGPRRGLPLAVFSLAMLAAILETAMLFLIARLAASFAGGAPGEWIELSLSGLVQWKVSLRQIVLISAGLLVAEMLLIIPLSSLTARLSSDALTRARDRVLTAHLSAAWSHRSKEVEDHFQRLMGDDSNHVEMIVQQWSTIVVALTGILMLAAAALVIAPVPTLVGSLALVLIVQALRPMARRTKQSAAQFQSANRDLMTNVAQTARLDKEVAAFEVGDRVKASLMSGVAGSSSILHRLRFNQRATPMLFLDSSLALVLVGIAVLSALDVGSVDYLGPLILLMVRALGYTRQLQSATHSSHEMAPYVLDLEREIASLHDSHLPVGSRTLSEIGEIGFEQVSFSYPDGRPILRDVDLTIACGDIIGLIGSSGSGKTTLTELLLRLREPTSGRITISGMEISEVAPLEWARLVAYVPQGNSLIRATVAENIAFFRSSHSREEIERAARQAHLHEEIMRMPDGYDTRVGPGERSLSGGQCQRLGIARALLGRPQLLVLDEPTSALDERSELLIKRTLTELRGSVTMIVVAHRPTTLEVCSRIVRLSGGFIEELGLSPVSPEFVDLG